MMKINNSLLTTGLAFDVVWAKKQNSSELVT